jgi:hypothetical protein
VFLSHLCRQITNKTKHKDIYVNLAVSSFTSLTSFTQSVICCITTTVTVPLFLLIGQALPSDDRSPQQGEANGEHLSQNYYTRQLDLFDTVIDTVNRCDNPTPSSLEINLRARVQQPRIDKSIARHHGGLGGAARSGSARLINRVTTEIAGGRSTPGLWTRYIAEENPRNDA